MKKLIMLTAMTMLSVAMASTAFAGEVGYRNSGNDNACFNAGAGNGGESIGIIGEACGAPLADRESVDLGDRDPGNHPANNSAPPVPPGSCKQLAGGCN